MVVHRPRASLLRTRVRSQWHHVIDGRADHSRRQRACSEPKSVNGIMHKRRSKGVSMVYTFADAKAPSRHKARSAFEIFSNRPIYNDGWLARTIHRAAWEFKPRGTLEADVWELFDTRSDFSLANDLAAQNRQN